MATDQSDGRAPRWHRAAAALRFVVILALAMLALTAILRPVVVHVIGVPLWDDYWLRDYAGNLAVALVAGALIRRPVASIAFASFVIVAFNLINATKLQVLGLPGAPEDFANVANLYRLAAGPAKLGVIAAAASPFVLLAVLVRWRERATWVAFAALAAGVTLVAGNAAAVSGALDARFGNSAWNQAGNFRERGLALHLVQEAVRRHPADDVAPSAGAVDLALANVPLTAVDFDDTERRDVHVFVLESFFDPVSLGPALVPEDPFPAEFRALWDATGHSVALSPTFGGYTANAEFEALCGFPVTDNLVFFEGSLLRSAPCLPRVLADAGYRTVASHPNVPNFWNRTLAYRLLGFAKFISAKSFDLSDSVDSFLLDHAFYDQVFARLDEAPAGGKARPDDPVFNYMLTYHGHLPYPSNDAYPDHVSTPGDNDILHRYVNQLWYKSRDLMARLAILREEDPDALIVIFGDHLPFLGKSYGTYTDALGLPPGRGEFTPEQYEFLVSTPLIVIDGERGPVNVGRVPLYGLPALILDRLGVAGHGAFAWAGDAAAERIHRPVYGLQVEMSADTAARNAEQTVAASGRTDSRVCVPERATSPACEAALSWLERVRLLSADVFSGEQHSLDRLGPLGDG